MGKKQEYHENWKRCDISYLVHHFHQFTGKNDSKHHERLKAVHLEKKDIDVLFGDPACVEYFNIWMGLDSQKSSPESFTFKPTIEVKLKDVKDPIIKAFQYGEPKVSPKSPVPDHQVPLPFKEWMVKNWMELDTSLVDDAFVAFLPDKNRVIPAAASPGPPNLLQRLLGYHFTDDSTNRKGSIVEGINKEILLFIRKQTAITRFIFHLGVDNNRAGHKDQFNFTPVFEITSVGGPKNIDSYLLGLKSFKVPSVGSSLTTNTYVEYLAPCPSTC